MLSENLKEGDVESVSCLRGVTFPRVPSLMIDPYPGSSHTHCVALTHPFPSHNYIVESTKTLRGVPLYDGDKIGHTVQVRNGFTLERKELWYCN